MKKRIAIITSLIMTVSTIPVSAVSADSYVTGDVDMDGMITGHDAAIISRSLNDDNLILTEEQLILADMNGDGTVDSADAAAIHAAKEYFLGDADLNGMINLSDANFAITSLIASGEYVGTADLDADGDIDIGDYWQCMWYYASLGATLEVFESTGQYYCSYDLWDSTYDTMNALGDIDNDGRLTGHDSAMITGYLNGCYTLSENQITRADVTCDGTLTSEDARAIMENQQYMLGDVTLNGTIEIEDAALLLRYYSLNTVGRGNECTLTRIQRNLADVNLDGKCNLNDAKAILMFYAMMSPGLTMEEFAGDSQYGYMAELMMYIHGM